MLAIGLFPVNEWLLFPLENRFPANPLLPNRVDGIIVLSGSERLGYSSAWGQPELNNGAERDLAFLVLARRFPDAKLAFSGGSGSMVYQRYKAATVAEALFEQHGLARSRVIFEPDSRNTYENVVNSKVLLKPTRGEKWLLITSAFHMPRSVGLFCKAGWPVLPYPVDHNTWRGNLLRIDYDPGTHLAELEIAIHEWIGLVAYYLTGKTSSLLPAACG